MLVFDAALSTAIETDGKAGPKQMPPGPYKSSHPLATPPLKERTMHDIETLIAHFLSVSWGPVIPPGEAHVGIEATKGNNGYYLTSDGNTMPYRGRIRTPSFAHMQMVPLLSRGRMIPDLRAKYDRWQRNRLRKKFDVHTGGRANDWDRRLH